MDLSPSPLPIAQPSARKAPPMAYRSASPSQAGSLTSAHSPPHRGIHSASPRVISPAGSQIFERDVQDDSGLTGPSSPAIPSHIQTENHIPPVLDASSEAITNHAIDPDNVEIVMHSLHQSAATAVAGLGHDSMTSSWHEHDAAFGAHTDTAESTSNYGSLDTADVKRLSFISFADVVQSEHAEQLSGLRDHSQITGLTSLSPQSVNRSPSPVRSPGSSQGFSISPPTSQSASIKGMDISPMRKLAPQAPGAMERSDLTVETMTQALRRTGSGDLGGIRSQTMSPQLPLSPSSTGA